MAAYRAVNLHSCGLHASAQADGYYAAAVSKRIRVWGLETGHDNFVSHAMSYAEKGQQETFEVTE